MTMDDTERRRLYRKVFNSADGKKVIADLVATFDADGPSFVPMPNEGADPKRPALRYDPLHAAILDGQKQAVKHCQKLSAPEKKQTKKAAVKK